MSVINHAVHQENPLVRLRGVTKTYATPAGQGEFTALDNVSLTFAQGAFTAIVGKSGSGKSTLLNLLGGLDRPDRGEILVGDVPVHTLNETRLSAWRGREVGIVFQFFQLLPTLTVLENVLLPMDLRHVPGRRSRRRRVAPA